MHIYPPFTEPIQTLDLRLGAGSVRISGATCQIAINVWPPNVWVKEKDQPWRRSTAPDQWYDLQWAWQEARLSDALEVHDCFDLGFKTRQFAFHARNVQQILEESLLLRHMTRQIPSKERQLLQDGGFVEQLPIALGLYKFGRAFRLLCSTDPALAFWIADASLCEGKVDDSILRTILSSPRFQKIDVLPLLGMPPDPSIIEVLRKFSTEAITRANLVLFQRVTSEKAFARLRELSPISPLLLRFLSEPFSELLGKQLLEEVTLLKPSYRQSAVKNIGDRFSRLWPQLKTLAFEGHFESVRDFENFFTNMETYDWMKEIRFPNCPLEMRSDLLTVEPISTGCALFEEGRRMNFCVNDYFDAALDGRIFFFQVLSPHRASLCIVGEPGEPYRILAFTGAPQQRNVKKAEDACLQWLADVQGCSKKQVRRPTQSSHFEQSRVEGSDTYMADFDDVPF